MRVKTSELKDVALDWAVGQAAGIFGPEGWYAGTRVIQGKLHLLSDTGDVFNAPYMPSTNWAQGGLIIEREYICIDGSPEMSGYDWQAATWLNAHRQRGETPLVAAMRCYVASKLGEEVDVPEELK